MVLPQMGDKKTRAAYLRIGNTSATINPLMGRQRFSLRQVFIAAAVIIAFMMLADFNNRWNEKERLSMQYEQAVELREQLVATKTALEAQIEYARSDSAVEEWAYSEGGLARPGDVVIEPLPAPGGEPTPTPTPQPRGPEKSNFEIWWSLFFGPDSDER